MSYYSDSRNARPGDINGNALDGLRSRVTICVKRVLDSCSRQLSLDNTQLELDYAAEGKAPFVFTGAGSRQIDAIVSHLRVTRFEERPNFARVQCSVTVPLLVTFRDANGEEYQASSQISFPQDVVMYIPQASVFPFEVVAAASCSCVNGKFKDSGLIECTVCLTVIMKVIAETDLLVPAYGYCPSPKAVEYESEVCNKFFELPLYPSGK